LVNTERLQTLEVKYTKILTDADFAVHAIKSDLTPALSNFLL
jgi:hypothetical protein